MSGTTITLAIFLAFEFALLVYAWWDSIVGPRGWFWYHTEIEYGHMLANLGTRHTLIIFGKWFGWVKRDV